MKISRKKLQNICFTHISRKVKVRYLWVQKIGFNKTLSFSNRILWQFWGMSDNKLSYRKKIIKFYFFLKKLSIVFCWPLDVTFLKGLLTLALDFIGLSFLAKMSSNCDREGDWERDSTQISDFSNSSSESISANLGGFWGLRKGEHEVLKEFWETKRKEKF